MALWNDISMTETVGFQPGDEVVIHAPARSSDTETTVSGGLYVLKVLDQSGFTITVCHPDYWWWKKLLYKLHQTERILFGAFVRILYVWSLSDWTPGSTPTWRDVPLVRNFLRRNEEA